jgi:hypothetical protein
MKPLAPSRRAAREQWVHAQAEDEDRDLGAYILDAPYALREVLRPARVEDGARRNDASRRGGWSEMNPEDLP